MTGQTARQKTSPFDYVNAVSEEKQKAVSPVDDGTLPEKDHNVFLTNRALSLHRDTLGFAQEMNVRSGIDRRNHFNFLYFAVPRRRRRAKWPKADSAGDDVEVVRRWYGYGPARSAEVAQTLGPDAVADLRARMKED